MTLSNKKILLVEDDNFIGDMLARRLKFEGAICTFAVNGEEGLQKLKAQNYDFDIVLTDIMMTKMDGYEMIQEIKKDERAANLPIIVLTNRSSLSPKTERIEELGIDGMYIKSSTPVSQIVKYVEEALEKKQKSEQTNARTDI